MKQYFINHTEVHCQDEGGTNDGDENDDADTLLILSKIINS